MSESPETCLLILEASKTHNQHSTLVDGIARADLARQQKAKSSGSTVILADPTLHHQLSAYVQSEAELRQVRVMNPLKRRLVRKSLLEAWTVLRSAWRLKKDEVILVSTLLPSAGFLVELAKWLIPEKRVVVMLHGELEGLLDPKRQRIGSFGFYVKVWLALRRLLGSRLELAVIAPFIRSGLLERANDAIRPDMLHLLPIPIDPYDASRVERKGGFRFGFIGFDTPNKGFSDFEALAREFTEDEFVHIGGGEIQPIGAEGEKRELSSSDDFMDAIASCDCAIFPYRGGYTLAMSAAATDTIAAGTHIMASPRPCFLDLRAAYGNEAVTICADVDAMRSCLSDPQWRETLRNGIMHELKDAPYSLPALTEAIARMLANAPGYRQGG